MNIPLGRPTKRVILLTPDGSVKQNGRGSGRSDSSVVRLVRKE